MKVLLVNPPNNYSDTFELAPPLGLLSLAAMLRRDDVDVEILDLNLRGIGDHSFVDTGFYEKALGLVELKAPDVVGLTSMVVNSHVALELGRRIKAADRSVRVILGGTHFSAIAEEVLHLYPWVDYVLKGEAELSFRELVRALRAGRPPTSAGAPRNVAFRDGAEIVTSHVKRPFESMDELPDPAYDLVDVGEYFRLNPDRVLDYESGRGCIYKCSFCYSPVHYGSGGQSKEVDRILSDMHRLQGLGAGHLFFVQDNFLNNTRFTRELCAAIAGAGLDLTWNCYSTLPQMTEETVRLLGAAGCTNAFTGIDAVNEECQKEFLKKFYKGWEPLERTLRRCVESGVTPTCAFLVENPSAGVESVNRTLVTALFAKCNGAGLRLNTLTLYNGTPSEQAHQDATLSYSELKPRLLLDCPELVQVNDYAREHPRLFPFHNTYLDPVLWYRFAAGMHITYTLFQSFPMTLFRWVTEDKGSLWGLAEELIPQVPYLPDVHPDERRGLERSLFARWFEKQPRVHRITSETFDLERAELIASGRAEPLRRAVRTPRTDGSRQVLVDHFEVARIGYRVEDLHRFDLQALPERSAPRPVLLKRNGRSLRYLDIPPQVADTLAAVRHAEDEVVSVSDDVLRTLEGVGLVTDMVGTA